VWGEGGVLTLFSCIMLSLARIAPQLVVKVYLNAIIHHAPHKTQRENDNINERDSQNPNEKTPQIDAQTLQKAPKCSLATKSSQIVLVCADA
jgi:hypothetical protein